MGHLCSLCQDVHFPNADLDPERGSLQWRTPAPSCPPSGGVCSEKSPPSRPPDTRIFVRIPHWGTALERVLKPQSLLSEVWLGHSLGTLLHWRGPCSSGATFMDKEGGRYLPCWLDCSFPKLFFFLIQNYDPTCHRVQDLYGNCVLFCHLAVKQSGYRQREVGLFCDTQQTAPRSPPAPCGWADCLILAFPRNELDWRERVMRKLLPFFPTVEHLLLHLPGHPRLVS